MIVRQLHSAVLFFCLIVIIAGCPTRALAQSRPRHTEERVYPKEIRGYKVERVVVEPKQAGTPLLTFGQANVITIAPLGVTLEIPIVIEPVKQKGRVDFLSFYDVTINGTRVEVADYNESFDLPTERPLTLARPIRVFVAMPRALIGAVLEWASPQPTWSVTGVVYVFGQFKKAIFKFKRVVPVEVDREMRNPLLDERQ